MPILMNVNVNFDCIIMRYWATRMDFHAYLEDYTGATHFRF